MMKNQLRLLGDHPFWDKQPVKKFGDDLPKKDCPIEHKQVKDISNEASKLPAGFEWCTVDLKDDSQAEQLYHLLREHYVEDSEGNFRFDYPVELIRWVLLVPHYR